MTIIQHNIAAQNSQRSLAANNTRVSKSLEKLSTGYRINSAADDAAGLAISEKMRAQVVGLGRAELNARDGVSLIQTAEGALAEVHDILNRMEEISVQSANAINSEVERRALNDEMDALKEEINRISLATQFNGMSLLDGTLSALGKVSAGVVPINTGIAPPQITVSANSVFGGVPKEFLEKGTGAVSVTATPAGNADSLEFTVAGKEGGTVSFTLPMTSRLIKTAGIQNLDLSPFGSLQINNSNTAMFVDDDSFISGLASALNSMSPQLTVTPSDNALVLQIGDQAYMFDRMEVGINDMSAAGLGLGGVNVLTVDNSLNGLGTIREAIDLVSEQRGSLGAKQNRLDHAILNLSNMGLNITDSESRIRDTDMAKEMMTLTKENILTQSAQAMLAQANTQPQQVLQLLQ